MAKKYDLIQNLMSAGAVAGGYIAGKGLNKIPFVATLNPWLRAGGKIAIGLGIPILLENKKGKEDSLIAKVGFGLAANGAHEAVAQVVPALAGIPFASPRLLNADMGALEGEGALGALEDQAAMSGPGNATI